MSDPSVISARLQSILDNKDFFTSTGDLLAVAEALLDATDEGVDNVMRKLLDGARIRIGLLSVLNDLDNKLQNLAPVDSTTVALGSTQAESDALVAELGKADLTLTTKSTYYLSSQTYNSSGTLTSAIGPHIASAAEKTTAEGGTLLGSPAADGDETHLVATSGGGYTIYFLDKNNTVLTASKADVTTALGKVEDAIEPLLETASDDILNLEAYRDQHLSRKDRSSIGQARSEDNNRRSDRLNDFVELAKVATQRAQELRNNANARSNAAT